MEGFPSLFWTTKGLHGYEQLKNENHLEQRKPAPVSHVALDVTIIEFAANETLRVKDGVFRIGVKGILSSVSHTVLR
jgi:hypothetical protein